MVVLNSLALIPTFLFLTTMGVDDGLRYVSSLADI